VSESETLTLFAGNANPALAHDIARHLTTPLGGATSEGFPTAR
jgi:phosphoribosylpyrophosphate synthetase